MSCLLQIWNVNAHTGIVGVFNLQGSSWDRNKRQYFVHDATPPTLDVLVRPRDIEPFRSSHQQTAGSEASSGSSCSQTGSFACYSNQSERLERLSMDEGCLVELSGMLLEGPLRVQLSEESASLLKCCCE